MRSCPRGSGKSNGRGCQGARRRQISARGCSACWVIETYLSNLVLAGRSLAEISSSANFVNGAAIPEGFAKALVDARRALAIAPELPEGQKALAQIYTWGSLDFTQASEAWDRAKSLAPDDARILREYGLFSVIVGRPGAGLAAAQRAVVLDPLGAHSHFTLGQSLFLAHHYPESVTAYNDALALEPGTVETYGYRGLAYYQLGDFDSARSSCQKVSEAWEGLWCLAIVYDKLGRHADAEAAFEKLTAYFGDAPAWQNAEIYAQWGNSTKSLDWLDKALQVHDPGVSMLRTDPFVDSMRKELRFQAVERALKFPDRKPDDNRPGRVPESPGSPPPGPDHHYPFDDRPRISDPGGGFLQPYQAAPSPNQPVSWPNSLADGCRWRLAAAGVTTALKQLTLLAPGVAFGLHSHDDCYRMAGSLRCSRIHNYVGGDSSHEDTHKIDPRIRIGSDADHCGGGLRPSAVHE